jgi:hypothetical protein
LAVRRGLLRRQKRGSCWSSARRLGKGHWRGLERPGGTKTEQKLRVFDPMVTFIDVERHQAGVRWFQGLLGTRSCGFKKVTMGQWHHQRPWHRAPGCKPRLSLAVWLQVPDF